MSVAILSSIAVISNFDSAHAKTSSLETFAKYVWEFPKGASSNFLENLSGVKLYAIITLSIILDLRRYSVMEESSAPSELNNVFSNIENNGAPWPFPATDRLNWKDEE